MFDPHWVTASLWCWILVWVYRQWQQHNRPDKLLQFHLGLTHHTFCFYKTCCIKCCIKLQHTSSVELDACCIKFTFQWTCIFFRYQFSKKKVTHFFIPCSFFKSCLLVGWSHTAVCAWCAFPNVNWNGSIIHTALLVDTH